MADKQRGIPRFTFLNRTRNAKGKTVAKKAVMRRRNKKGK